jgi:hypothetical protein
MPKMRTHRWAGANLSTDNMVRIQGDAVRSGVPVSESAPVAVGPTVMRPIRAYARTYELVELHRRLGV